MKNGKNNIESTCPTLGVCMPYYNSSTYVKDAIISLKKQVYKKGHLLVLDDGSNSEELKILEKALKEIPGHYTLIRSKHQGLFASRGKMGDSLNDGVILNLDADDFYLNDNVFVDIANVFKDKNVDALFFKFIRDWDGTNDNEALNEVVKTEPLIRSKFQKGFIKSGKYNNIHCKAFRPRVIKQIKCDKNIKLTFSEDRYFSALIFTSCNNIVYTNKPLYFYRGNENSETTKKYTYEIFKDQIYVEQQLSKIIKNGDIDYYDISYQYQLIIYYNLYRIFMDDSNYSTKKKRAILLRNDDLVEQNLNIKLSNIVLFRKFLLRLFKNKCYFLLNLFYLVDKFFTKSKFGRNKFSRWGF